jgi:transcription termination factor Rho
MLDHVISIEGQPTDEWKAPTAFDNLTPLFPKGRIMLENDSRMRPACAPSTCSRRSGAVSAD